MQALRLALSFVLVPRLFASLLLFPLLISFLVVYFQLVTTRIILRATDSSTERKEESFEKIRNQSFVRSILFGEQAELDSLLVCRWQIVEVEGKAIERPPSPECAPDRLDAAVKVDNPADFDVTAYEKVLLGNVIRLHVCRECRPDLVINLQGQQPRTELSSVWAWMILGQIRFSDAVKENVLQVSRTVEELEALLGVTYFKPVGYQSPLQVSGSQHSVAIVFNVISLILLALWLAMRAHRKVLDYFARSGALLPMVAATGRTTFYSALWLITFFRVAAFLFAAIPVTWQVLAGSVSKGGGEAIFFGGDLASAAIWVICVFCSLSLATLVASIADLKHRHNLFSVFYRYVPLLLCFAGAVVWAGSFLVDGVVAANLRNIITSLPIIGITPVLLAPLLRPDLMTLTAHTVLTFAILVAALKINARWFAAHLEEI